MEGTTSWEFCQAVESPGELYVYQGGRQVRHLRGSFLSFQDTFAELGSDGWELVSVVKHEGLLRHYFKRPALD